jgi:hypothetical protein
MCRPLIRRGRGELGRGETGPCAKAKESGPEEKRVRRKKKRMGRGLKKEREGEEGCWAGPRGEGERGFGKFSFLFLTFVLNLFKL